MNQYVNEHNKGYELEGTASELELLIQRMARRENDEREKLSKRYTSQEEKEAAAYDRGFSDGYQAGTQDGFGKGFDAGLKQAAKEREEKSEK